MRQREASPPKDTASASKMEKALVNQGLFFALKFRLSKHQAIG
jgi:hypothetical protein